MIASSKEIDALNITLFNSCINFTNVHPCNYCTKIFVIVVNTCVCRRSVDNKALILCSVPYYCYPFASFKSSNKYKRNEYRGQITKEQKCLNEPELLWYKRNKNALLVIISHYKKAKTETDPEKLCFFKMTGIPRHRKHFRVAMMTCLLAILLPPTASSLAINAFDHLSVIV